MLFLKEENMANSCEMCLMPFDKDKGVRESQAYCSYCFKGGSLVYQGEDVKSFQKLCYQSMIRNGANKYMAKIYTWFIPFAPYWKKLKRNEDKTKKE